MVNTGQTTIIPTNLQVSQGQKDAFYTVTCSDPRNMGPAGVTTDGQTIDSWGGWTRDRIDSNHYKLLFDVPLSASVRAYNFWVTYSLSGTFYAQKVQLTVKPAHDVSVSNISPINGEHVSLGGPVEVSATVTASNYTEHPNVTLSITSASGYSYSDSEIPTVSGSQPVIFSPNWDTTGLIPGNYTLTVTAAIGDDTNNGNDTQSVIITIDPPPLLQINTGINATNNQQGATVLIWATVTGGGSPINDGDVVAHIIWPDGSQTNPAMLYDSSDSRYECSFVASQVGTYSGQVNASRAGYQSGSSQFSVINISNAAPDTTISSQFPAPGEWIRQTVLNLAWIGSDTGTAVSDLQYSWQLDGSAWTTWAPEQITQLRSLGDGEHTFSVKSYDGSLEDPDPALRTFFVDSSAPVVTITTNSGNDIQTEAAQLVLEGTATDPAPSSGLSEVSLPAGTTNEGTISDWQFTVELQSGENIITIYATDTAGNLGSDAIVVIYDPPGPILYVDCDAIAGANDGTNWENAFVHLQDALAVATQSSDTVDEIWVAEGTYKPDQGVGITPGDRTAAFQLPGEVVLKGGLAGFGAADPSARDTVVYKTILSGDLNADDAQAINPNDLLTHPSRMDNSYHVIVAGIDSVSFEEPIALDGIVVQGGNANNVEGGHDSGGGILVIPWCHSMLVTNCVFANNAASQHGGAVYFRSHLLLQDCLFAGNHAAIAGGALAGTSYLDMLNCTLVDNLAPEGRGIAYDPDDAIQFITNCILWNGGGEVWESYGGAGTSITYSDIQGGWPGQGNIDIDPSFVDPDGADNVVETWLDNDYRFRSDSPCINTGDPAYVADPDATDLAGNPRIVGTVVDMGAYEHQSLIRSLTISSSNGGSVTDPAEGAILYDEGTLVLIQATADQNYHFVNWTGTAVDAGQVADPSSASTTVTVDSDYTLQANFLLDRYYLAISSSITGGTVTTPGEGIDSYDSGTVLSIIATPDIGYAFVNWTGTAVDAGKVENPNSADTTVTIDADYTILANFAAMTYTLNTSVNPGGGGSVTKNPNKLVYSYNESVQLTANANSGYTFSYWSGDASGSTNPTTIIMNSNMSVMANFTAQTGSLQVTLGPSGAVSAGAQWNVDGGSWQNSGATVSGLSIGSHTVNYKSITGWTAPPGEAVIINNGQTTSVSRTYTSVKPTVSIAATDSSAGEPSNNGSFTVSRTGGTSGNLRVYYSTSGSTATSGTDYTTLPGYVDIPSGQASVLISVTVIDDNTNEDSETVHLTISSDAAYTIGSPSGATVTIADNDKPTVSITATDASAGEPSNNGSFTVSRTGSTSGSLRVYYSTSGSTATSGTDYTTLPGYVDIPSGQASVLISVTVIDDNQTENSETVVVTLSSDSAYDIDPSHSNATVTIADNDEKTPPEISGLIPEPNSVQVSRDTIIQLHVTDSGSGVAYHGGTVTIRVEGDLIYDGSNETSEGIYDSTGSAQTFRGVCARTGTPADYTFVFQSSAPFDYEQKVDVTVNAADEAGNVMPEENYYFYTAMRSFGKNARVNSDTGTLAQDHPASVTDSAGNIWVVWDQTNSAGNRDIYVGILPEGANAFQTSAPVADRANNERRPTIAVDANDVVYVAWEADDPNGHWDVLVSSSSNGTTWSEPVVVNVGDPNNTSDQLSPAIAIDRLATNTIYVTYEDNRAVNTDIWLASSTAGTAWTETQITSNASDQLKPAIAVDRDDGTVYVGWTDTRNMPTSGTDIYGGLSDDSWYNELLAGGPGNQHSLAVAAGRSAHVLWIGDADSQVLYDNEPTDLVPYEGQTIVDEPNTVASDPTIALRVTGGSTKVFAAWTDGRNISSNNDTDIYYAESGSPFGTNILVNDDVGTSSQTSPAINVDSRGNPYIVWVDERNGNKDIYYAGATALDDPLATTIVIDGSNMTVKASSVENLQVAFPMDALPAGVDVNNVNITIAELLNPPELPVGGFGVCYDFGPSGLQFNPAATITIPHSAADCPGYSVYKVYCYNAQSGTWSQDGISNVQHKAISGTVHTVSFQTTHFTAFVVGGSTVAPPPPSGGGGGGGGGCDMSPNHPGNLIGYLVPYVLLSCVWLGIRRRDARNRTKA